MVQQLVPELPKEEDLLIPKIDIEFKENIGQYFKLLLAETPRLKFTITDKKNKEIYSNLLNVEMR